MGDIYLLESPSGKKYIGQALQFYKNKKKAGYINRWKQHIYEATNNKNFCRLLDKAIIKYKPENFKISLLCSCDINMMDEIEANYIEKYNTLTPNGYNLIARSGKGGHQSDETSKLKSKSLKGKNLGRVINIKKLRKNSIDNTLPKYMRSCQNGYRISNHPSKINFCSRSLKKSMEEKYNECLNKLNIINEQLIT